MSSHAARGLGLERDPWMRRLRHLALVAALCTAGCSPEPPASTVAPTPERVDAAGRSTSAADVPPRTEALEATATRPERSRDPAVVALRRAIDFGDRDAIVANLAASSKAGNEGVLLRARASAQLDGGVIAALRTVEEARAADPRDPEVYATAAEIYAAREAFDAAWNEIQRGDEACGKAPALERARGIAYISRENGAKKGLEHLERARALDPELPFCDRALGQAHLLCAKLAAKDSKLDVALVHARASVRFDPAEIDAQRMLSEVLAAHGDFRGALEVLKALDASAGDLRGELASLHKRSAVAELLRSQRQAALEDFAAARALGLSDDELGTGARLLGEEAARRVDLGVKAFEARDLAGAQREFEAALKFDPTHLAAQNHLGIVRFEARDFAGAALAWKAVLDAARADELELPDPVHLNLAKALVKTGDVEGARRVLEGSLEVAYETRWAERTKALLAELPPR